MGVDAIRFVDGALELIDQRVLPHEETWIRCTNATETADAIRDMVVRGAPAIGITAAYGYALEVMAGGDRAAAHEVLYAARPTAVNLRWALEELAEVPTDALLDAAKRMHAEDIAINQAMGGHGAALLPKGAQLYHHCNTGALATGGWGTALGIVRSAAAADPSVHVWVGETRPYLQGARLTAWELLQEGIDCTLVADSVAATLMAAGKVDAVLVGCDRVAANGDVANKVGTLMLAVLAKRYDVPVYVGMPMSTLDTRCPTGADIPIEERDASEVRGHRGVEWAADVPVYNPAFDVTPAELIAGWVTENGLWWPPGHARS
ncbi:MAG: S-methyl-5-thioribose-1-phosphate isomerase [Deltaproteobacteria bacterium]|nr:MAG: S-methyl-5-thioribose-1-phosphate isomerase [Deltaproteobacteria bacterium]